MCEGKRIQLKYLSPDKRRVRKTQRNNCVHRINRGKKNRVGTFVRKAGWLCECPTVNGMEGKNIWTDRTATNSNRYPRSNIFRWIGDKREQTEQKECDSAHIGDWMDKKIGDGNRGQDEIPSIYIYIYIQNFIGFDANLG